MRRIFKWLVNALALLLVTMIGIVAIRTLTFSSRQLAVDPVPPFSVDEQAHLRFAQSLRYTTESFPASVDTAAFEAFWAFVDSSYQYIDSLLVRDTINAFSRIYYWEGSDPGLKPILLTGHTDVVPVESAAISEWTVPPYDGTLKDDYFWGRGTMDDKIGVIPIMEAAEKLLRRGFQPARTIYFAFGHDEETGGQKGAKAMAAHFEKQNLRFAFVLDEGLLQLEDALAGLDRPVSLVGIAEKGFLTLNVSAVLPKGGHSAMPPKEGAIDIVGQALSKLRQHSFPKKISGPALTLFEYTGPEMPLLTKMVFANLWLFEPVVIRQLDASPVSRSYLHTTIAPTMIRGGVSENVMPTTATAKVNFRILPGSDIQEVFNYVKSVIDDDRVIVSISEGTFMSEPSDISDHESFGFRLIQRTSQEVFPRAVVAPSLVVVASDARHYRPVADDIYRFLPVRVTRADLSRIHGIDERISVENFDQAVRFFSRLMENGAK